jgi:hypothetical protein
MKNTENAGKKSPLKEAPLRLPGQSIEEQIEKSWDKAEPYGLLVVFFVMLAAIEWYRKLAPASPIPWSYLFTLCALIAILVAIPKFQKYRVDLKSLRLGRDGERIVAEHLDNLKEEGYRVLHDLVAANFNVDHVLVGPKGVFAIETKTWSKTPKQKDRIQFEGSSIYMNGRKIVPNPVDQAKANAGWLREILRRSTGKNFKVIPVVVFPGWFVELKSKATDIFVLNPKQLDPVLTALPRVLPGDDVSLISFHLEQFVRSKQADV